MKPAAKHKPRWLCQKHSSPALSACAPLGELLRRPEMSLEAAANGLGCLPMAPSSDEPLRSRPRGVAGPGEAPPPLGPCCSGPPLGVMAMAALKRPARPSMAAAAGAQA